ncbi:MAG: VWA domain-containing protein [Planctomycetota bacterium]|nr:VWA domain-containing protein [Planctomycetota bacterium]
MTTHFLRRLTDNSAFSRILIFAGIFSVLMLSFSTELAHADVSAEKKKLLNAIRSDQFDPASRAVDSLVKIGTPKAFDALVSVGLGGDYYGIERYIGSKLVSLPAGEGFDRVCELATEDRRSSARVILTLVLAHRTDLGANKAVLTNLYDKDASVALTSVEALAKKENLASVDHLIEALARLEKVRRHDTLLGYEIRKCLLKITGEDFKNADDWRNFWAPRKDTYKKPPPGSAKKKGMTSVRRDPPAFFGMEVVAKNVIFLLDVSGSMEKIDDLPEEPGSSTPGGTRVGDEPESEPKDSAPNPARQRLKRVQNELIRTIERLPQDVAFNIVTFNHEIKSMSKGLKKASSRHKREAISYVRNFEAQGETWTDHALREAFGAPNLRAIFLLSDGAPRRDNQLLDTGPILKWVREANRFRRVRLNTVGFSQAGKKLRSFMENLARQNNGEFIELK